MEVKNPISQNITIFPKINEKRIKKILLINALNTWSGLL